MVNAKNVGVIVAIICGVAIVSSYLYLTVSYFKTKAEATRQKARAANIERAISIMESYNAVEQECYYDVEHLRDAIR